MRHVLVARLDSAGDVLLTGPAVRAVAAGSDKVTFLAGPRGAAAARLLPGVDEVVEFHAGWVDFDAPPVTQDAIDALLETLRALAPTEAVIFTSFHQSPLPLALVLRMAGVGRIAGISIDYPGSLLDLRDTRDEDRPEQIRNLALAEAAGFPGDSDGLRIREDLLPDVGTRTGGPGYIVVHPGAAVPARRPAPERMRTHVAALVRAGYRVLVTGGPDEHTAFVADGLATDLGGRTDLATLAAILRDADVVIAPNTGPAHLAVAVGTPVVSLFAPVVPAARWAPHGVPVVVLGRPAACEGTRARTCPVPGHPCLDTITSEEIVNAVDTLCARPADTRRPA
ncbi:glycosyltransferase family 9 protein [Nocardia rosealba]|uniref:glycosyltransferase family 9 protein n=1 Tax=Nocardia rosealba TaxID=2878563 RepID=UPI001CD9B3DC|nr:glycosyltransferase family 9 protein [Nocardia rosealba]MCA2207482.1 glycosyltransferase family 9 protein [Nocardia rosealba]